VGESEQGDPSGASGDRRGVRAGTRPTEEERQQLTAELEELAEEFEQLTVPLYAWYAAVWSQHDDEETHWTADDVAELVRACQDADPALWSWLQDETLRLMREHRDGIKKKSSRTG